MFGVSDGVDPLQVKREELHGNTVGDLCAYFLEQHAKRRKKSWQEDERRCNRHVIPALGRHLIKTVSRADIAALHRRIGMNSPYEANRVLALLSVMFEFAIKQGFREEAAGNPAKRIDKYPERKRDRWVTPAELPTLVAAIEPRDLLVCPHRPLALSSDRRPQERGPDHEVGGSGPLTASMAATGHQGRETHFVPLSEPVIDLLSQTLRQENNPYIICGLKEGSHRVNIDKAWRRVRKAAGIEDVRLHDLRRTVGSWLAQSGNSPHLIGRVLNHSNASTTQVYAHFAEDHVDFALANHAKQIPISSRLQWVHRPQTRRLTSHPLSFQSPFPAPGCLFGSRSFPSLPS